MYTDLAWRGGDATDRRETDTPPTRATSHVPCCWRLVGSPAALPAGARQASGCAGGRYTSAALGAAYSAALMGGVFRVEVAVGLLSHFGSRARGRAHTGEDESVTFFPAPAAHPHSREDERGNPAGRGNVNEWRRQR